jgi:hypothetical protein
VASTPKPSHQELPVTNRAPLPRQRVRSIPNDPIRTEIALAISQEPLLL